MYEPSKSFENFHIAGFQYWDGATVLKQLEPGMKLEIVPEFDNPYDPNALALYWEDAKLGFVPRDCNSTVAQLLHFGHGDVFECIVLGVDPLASTHKQVYVSLRITDARPSEK